MCVEERMNTSNGFIEEKADTNLFVERVLSHISVGMVQKAGTELVALFTLLNTTWYETRRHMKSDNEHNMMKRLVMKHF